MFRNCIYCDGTIENEMKQKIYKYIFFLESGIIMMKSFWKEIIDDQLSVCIRDTHTGKIVGKAMNRIGGGGCELSFPIKFYEDIKRILQMVFLYEGNTRGCRFNNTTGSSFSHGVCWCDQ